MAKRNKLENIVMEIYKELYANCTTPGDFELIVEAADMDENNKKIIPYDNYEIDSELFDEIVNKIMKRHRLKQHERMIVKWNVYLGCSPKTINKSDVRESITDDVSSLTTAIPMDYVTQ